MRVTFADQTTEPYNSESIGGGAEGDVFPSDDGRHLVKIYRTQSQAAATKIDDLIQKFNPVRGDSYWERYFAWPEKRVVAVDGKPMVGFRMPYAKNVRPLGFYIFGKSFNRLPPEERGWFLGRVAVAIKLVTAANRLSSLGLCYPDFSDNNVMVDPFEGNMTLIDCDSLTIPGKMAPTVVGSTWYRSPEIMMGKVGTPSVKTDRHNLAVLLYLWLLTWHPLIGDRVNDPANAEHDELLRYGARATYIEHPTDSSNRAKAQLVKSSSFGPEMHELFRQAFVEGVQNPDARPQPARWLEALNRLYDRLIPCSSPHCDWRWFPATPTAGLKCPKCGESWRYPGTLPFVTLFPHSGSSDRNDYITDAKGRHYVVGWQGRPLNLWHVKSGASPNYVDKQHPADRSAFAAFEFDSATQQWVLRNLKLPGLRCRRASDAPDHWREWPVNSAYWLEHDMEIQFGDSPDYFRARVAVPKVR